MVCIQCYLPPILFMVYMKLFHPFLAPYLEPAIDRVVALIWGPQAVQRGCPIKPKNTTTTTKESTLTSGGDSKCEPSTSAGAAAAKPKDD